MPAPPPRHLSLPEEFVLLSHFPSGKVHGSARAVVGCAAAELGELALRRKLLVRPRKSRMFGHDVYRLHGVRIELLDTGRTGQGWADEVMAGLEQRAASRPGSGTGRGQVSLNWWLRRRRQSFPPHRAALVRRGVLHHEPGRFLARERHHPHRAAREALIAELHAVNSGQLPLDEHMLFLSDLVEAVGLSRQLGCATNLRRRLDRSRGIGPAGSLPEEIRDTSTALASAVPASDNDRRHGRIRL